MAVTSTKPPANGFVRVMRKVYNPVGFSKGYNFVLFFIFAGAFTGFVLARFQYLDYFNIFCGEDGAAPGECFAYSKEKRYQTGIMVHLYTIIPGSFLACLQFIPVLRHKVLLFHRINGYISVLLSIASAAGSIMIAPVSFGGSLAIRAWVGLSTIMFLGSLLLAIYNVKKLQLDQHRAWMLRAWFYAGSILTTRLIMIIAAMIISSAGSDRFYISMPCDKLNSFYELTAELLEVHPLCSSLAARSPVMATMDGREEQVAAALSLGFEFGVWLALAIHAIGIETYLRLTPAEFERLREISYQRQVEAGFKDPGRAGLTVDRLGDSAQWVPEDQRNDIKLVSVEERAFASTPLMPEEPTRFLN
ncbi:hypothetical protein HJFPF1_02611 [Paramyrothecium foliicola]|nr:hypothetical protein HJFPF1_02611 [Paramyrothecium foliicola]